MKRIIILLVFLPVFFGCEGLLEPAIENHRDENSLLREAQLAQRILGHAYVSSPLTGWSFNDVATDDAVSNDPGNNYMQMATGQWRANNSPMNGNWQTRRSAIQYINLFLSMHEDVVWSKTENINQMFIDRMKGDAHGMRALFTYHLLLDFAGWTADNNLLGIPILTEPETVGSDFNKPRNTFVECIERIRTDVQVATENLPSFYPDEKDVTNDNVPEKYKNLGVRGAEYSRVFGLENGGGRMSGAIAEAILAQTYLMAASPAYSDASGVTWEQAANQFAKVLKLGLGNSPVDELASDGHKWYMIDATAGKNPKEILWRGDRGESADLERAHFPPMLYGNGRLNPTQNLVDAFPMENGYPATEENGYVPSKPYDKRDPRLELYIIYNGSKAGRNNVVINTAQDGPDDNALGRTEKSTRTGYYMKKHLIQGVNPDPSNENRLYHYKAYIRYTELFLGYAEAANEAWGPQGNGGNGFSAYSVIKAIRARAGITGGDAYLESIKGDQAKMRELIRNERRLELCFEGHRFWDLRRWKAPITEPAKGMRISGGTHSLIPVVEERAYADYMYHAPVPYSEILKFSNLVQNKGW